MIEEIGPTLEEPKPILVDTNVEQAPNKEPIASSSHQPEVVPDNIAKGNNTPKVPLRPILINPPMQHNQYENYWYDLPQCQYQIQF